MNKRTALLLGAVCLLAIGPARAAISSTADGATAVHPSVTQQQPTRLAAVVQKKAKTKKLVRKRTTKRRAIAKPKPGQTRWLNPQPEPPMPARVKPPKPPKPDLKR